MNTKVITQFLQDMADTATRMDLQAHMDLISKKIQISACPVLM